MIDAFASEPHYAAHLRPIWEALPVDVRGTFYAKPQASRMLPGIETVCKYPKGSRLLLAASAKDSVAYHRRPRVLLEHGAGQSYPGCQTLARSPSYAGGDSHDGTVLFLCPNDVVAWRWRHAYPTVRSAVVGCPRLDVWHSTYRPPVDENRKPVVAVSFHWDASSLCPEAGWALPYFKEELYQLAQLPDVHVLGHGHPRVYEGLLKDFYLKWGIEPVQNFDDVLDRADLYVIDNSSTAFEFASTGRPILWLESPEYRRDVHHGGRFWDWADAGLHAHPGQLLNKVREALADPAHVRVSREAVVSQVYAVRDGTSTARAVEEILRVAG